MSVEARDLISKLMIRNPLTRLGYNGASEIKQHPFFAGIDWSVFKERNSDGHFDGIYPPARSRVVIGKSKIAKAMDAIEEIKEPAGFVATRGDRG